MIPTESERVRTLSWNPYCAPDHSPEARTRPMISCPPRRRTPEVKAPHNALGPARSSLPLMLAMLAAAGCAAETENHLPATTTSGAAPSAAFSETFRVVRHISLEESQHVINVMPVVHIEPDGDLLLADAREAQVRWYSATGALRAAFGRKGQGPGEFQMPVTLRRLADGRFYVGDAMGGGISFINERLTEYVDGARLPLMPLYGAVPIDSLRLLLLGREQGMLHRPRLLHEWSLSSRRVERSFFEVPTADALSATALSLGFAAAAVKGDTVAAVFSVSDTVFLFRLDKGSPIEIAERIPIPFSQFSVSPPTPEALANERSRNDWLQTITMIAGLHWLEDGSFVVQWTIKRSADEEFGLLRMRRSGSKVFEIRDGPRLFAVAGNHFYLADPDSEVPSKWIVAELIER